MNYYYYYFCYYCYYYYYYSCYYYYYYYLCRACQCFQRVAKQPQAAEEPKLWKRRKHYTVALHFPQDAPPDATNCKPCREWHSKV